MHTQGVILRGVALPLKRIPRRNTDGPRQALDSFLCGDESKKRFR